MFSKILKSKTGFTITELMISILILAPLFIGTMYVFVKCIELNDIAANTTIATLAAKSKTSQIEITPFNQIISTYDNVSFTIYNFNGIGLTKINQINTDLLEIITTVCWQEKNGNIIGEDKNLNGHLETLEDTNNNNVMDSPVVVRTLKYDS